MDQAEINRQMQPWTDREISRFSFRTSLFRRRGLAVHEAEFLADRLALRDQQRDDRRVCLECDRLQRGLRCFAHEQGWIRGVSRDWQPLVRQLQRCPHFAFVKP